MLKTVHNLGSSAGCFSQIWKKPHNNFSGLSFGAISFNTLPYHGSMERRSRRAFPITTATPDSAALPAFCSRRARFVRTTQIRATGSESNSDASSSSSAAVQSAGNARKINFCQWCGGATKHDIPDGEEKMRAICTVCGRITYQNPKMVVGCLIEHDKKILLCKRNIEPSHGLWTLPAGYMEVGESASEGAIRETWEEAGADVEVLSPFAQLDIPLIGQTYIIFLAKLKKPHFAPGPESLECQLFALDDIPFDSLAFSSIFVTLKLYIDDIKRGKLNYHYGTITKRPGSSPSDMHAFSLDYYLQS